MVIMCDLVFSGDVCGFNIAVNTLCRLYHDLWLKGAKLKSKLGLLHSIQQPRSYQGPITALFHMFHM